MGGGDARAGLGLNDGCLVRSVKWLSIACLGPVGLGLALVFYEVLVAHSDTGDLTVLARVAFSLMDLGMAGFIVGLCVYAGLRARGIAAKAVVVALLGLPLGLPALVGAPIGLWAIWALAPYP